jgi:phytoene dehydrogenase-like protein
VYELVRALVRRLEALGGELQTGRRVSRVLVSGRRVRAVETADGAVTRTDGIVADLDEAVVREDLLGRARPNRPPERSLSGLALLLGVRGERADRAHHVIRFPADYDAEFDDVFLHRRPVRDPTLYLCSPGVTDPTVDPPGGEALFVLANAPAIGDGAPWEAEADRLVARLGFGDRVAVRVVRHPGTLARETAALGGAIYGRALHGRLATVRRPGRVVPGAEGLWIVGGTVHPGGGLPIVALGGRAAAREIGPA